MSASRNGFNEKVGVSTAVINRFMQSVTVGDLAAVEKCIERQPDAVTWRDNAHYTALHHAASAGQAAVAAFLLDHGADVEARTTDASRWDSVTPLIIAAQWEKNLDLVTLLAARGANLNALSGQGETALMKAAQGMIYNVNQGQGEKVLRTLIALGADETLKDSSGRTAFDIASSTGTPEAAAAIREAVAQRAEANLRHAQEDRARDQAGIENAVTAGIAAPAAILPPIKLKPKTPPSA